jgi:RNA-binding protein
MPLSSKERAALRAEAHRLNATVHVGHHGVTDAVRQSLDDDLRTLELV